jgi:hypothetical protein
VNLSIKHDAGGFYLNLTAMEAVLALDNVHVVSVTSDEFPEGLERRPTRDEEPNSAKFYFVNQDVIPWQTHVHFVLSGPTQQPMEPASMYVHLSVHDRKLILGLASWSRPTDRSPLIFDIHTETDPLDELKRAVLAILHRQEEYKGVTQDTIRLFIGPKESAVPLTRPVDVFLITNGDLILVRTPLDEADTQEPMQLPVIRWEEL